MKKFLKIILVLVVLIVIALVTLGIVFARKIDTVGFKQQVSLWVHNKTGRDLVIAGDIKPSFFPWVGIKIHDVRLSNAKGFAPENFLSVKEADLKVKVLPLLKGQVDIGKLTLEDLSLNLTKDAQGRGNWQDLTRGNRSPASLAVAPAVIKSELNSQPHAWKVSLATIELNNAAINWNDLQHQQQVQISKLHIKGRNIAENTKFPLALAFDLASNQPKVAGHFKLDSDVTVDLDQQVYQLKNVKFVGLFDKLPKLEFFATEILANFKSYQLSAPKIRLSFGTMRANANLSMTQLMATPLFNGGLYTANFNLKDFLRDFGIELNTQDVKALQSVMLQTTFNGTANKLYFNPLQIKLDDSDISGYFSAGLTGSKIMDFALKANKINVDRYLPAKKQNPTPAGAPPAVTASANAVPATPATMVAASVASPASSSVLSKMRLNGSLQIGELTVADTKFNNFYTQLFLTGGVFQATPLTADVFQGKTRGKVVVDLRSALPRFNIDENLAQIQINQLTKSDRLTGTANIETHLGMQGADTNSLLSTLNGHLKFTVQNGALLGINIPYQINRVLALVHKQAVPDEQGVENKTDFGIFTGSGLFSQGVFTNNDLLMQSQQFKLTGNGTVNLPTQAIVYRVNVVGLNQEKDAQGNLIPMERQLKIPLLITGSLSHPIVTPDIQAIAETLLKEKVLDKIEKFQQRPGNSPEELREKGRQLLRRFLH